MSRSLISSQAAHVGPGMKSARESLSCVSPNGKLKFGPYFALLAFTFVEGLRSATSICCEGQFVDQ